MKESEQSDVESLKIAASLGHDTLSAVGATVPMLPGSGETLTVSRNTVQGFIANMCGMTRTDHIAMVIYGGDEQTYSRKAHMRSTPAFDQLDWLVDLLGPYWGFPGFKTSRAPFLADSSSLASNLSTGPIRHSIA